MYDYLQTFQHYLKLWFAATTDEVTIPTLVDSDGRGKKVKQKSLFYIFVLKSIITSSEGPSTQNRQDSQGLKEEVGLLTGHDCLEQLACYHYLSYHCHSPPHHQQHQ